MLPGAGCMGALRVRACPVTGVTPLMMGVATARAPGREGAGWARMGRVLRAGRTLGGVDTGGGAEGRTTAAVAPGNHFVKSYKLSQFSSPVMIWPTVAGTTTFWPGWIMVMLAPGLGPALPPEVRGRMLGPVPGLAVLSRAGLMLVLTVGILE